MRLAVIGDVHAELAKLAQVVDHIRAVGCDGVLFVGDLGVNVRGAPQRHLQSVDQVLDAGRALGKPIAYVPGNHDLRDQSAPGNVDGLVAEVGGLRVGGIGGAGPDQFGFPYEWSEDDIRGRPPLDCDVLLCHTPPKNTPMDVVRFGQHVGSMAVRERAEAHEGFLVCGHIHESVSSIQLNQCLCMNVGGLGQPFGRPQVGFIERGPEGDHCWHTDLQTGKTQRWART